MEELVSDFIHPLPFLSLFSFLYSLITCICSVDFIYYVNSFIKWICLLYESLHIAIYQVDTYNDFQDDQGNKLHVGELRYVTKYGKEALSFVNHVPASDVKSALSLVVRLILEHSKVP